MPAMTMPYTVKDDEADQRPRAGRPDRRNAGRVAKASAWLSAITKTGTAPLPEDAPDEDSGGSRRPSAAARRCSSRHAAHRSRRPERLARPTGGAQRSSSRSSISRCPLPDFCPLMDRRFAEVQTLVAGDPTLRGHVRLLVGQFRPRPRSTRTPRGNRRRELKADPAVWRFATAPAEVVDRFAATFGVNVIREKDGTITHNLRTAVIGTGRTGRLDRRRQSMDGRPNRI